MPNTKSAAKAMRQSQKRKTNNLKTKAKTRTATKKVKKLIADNSIEEALKALQEAMAQLDKAAKKRVIHKNTANRKKSRLAKAINKASKK